MRKSLHEMPRDEITVSVMLAVDHRIIGLVARRRHYLIMEVVQFFNLLPFLFL